MKYIESRLWALALLIIIGMILPSAAWAEARHQLTVVAKPAMAGSFNNNSAELAVGETIHLYAYANNSFTFVQWTDESGTVVSKQMDFVYTMPERDVTLTAEYEYNPTNPANPARNYWNKDLGEVIVDDFSTGQLQSAVKTAIGNSNASAVMMITVAGVVNNNDFGVLNTYSACTLFDMSRVTGVTQVPSYAFDYSKLESVYLPSTIEKIGNRAFYECKQLSSIILYAMTPPTLENNVFTGVPDGLIVYVPAASIAQYQDAAGWKDFTFLPIQEDIRSISVSLPTGTKVADYANMWLELTNTKSGQKLHYVMTDRMLYTFSNIIRNTSWNVTLRNERGDEFGRIDNVNVKDEDVSVMFASLTKPQSVTLSVKTPDGKDVTEQTQVTWTDTQGNYVAQGTSLTGLPVGYQVNYRMALSQELAMAYNAPTEVAYTLKDGGNNITQQLSPITQITLSGKVKDATTGLPLSDAIVSASQTFSGKYSKTLNAKTDNKGEYTLTVADVPTSLGIAATDYISQTITFDNGLSGVNGLDDVSLKPITGATITVNLTYTTVEGETQDWYSDYQNVGYTLYNVTKKRGISQFNVQYPQIVLLEDVDDGDVLRLTATSRTNAFMPVESAATIAEQRAETTFNLVELGQLQVELSQTGNVNVAASLYDADGKLIKTEEYRDMSLTISNLTDGNYTLVSMGSSRFFNNVYDLSQLPQIGLTEGTDYVKNDVTIKSGEVTALNISLVPKFDERKLYYTGDNTSFSVNKPSIVVGNYLTLTGHLDFKPAYATNVSNVQLIVDLPESCSFVENSVMVGNSTSMYTKNGNQITIPTSQYSDRVRFCIIPTLEGNYTPSAFAQFDLNGETVRQPIGNAKFTADGLSISLPSIVNKTNVAISGTAIGVCDISIYDNDVLIGQTKSLSNGSWVTNCELNNAYNLSSHNIYAKIMTARGLELQTESATTTYDQNSAQVVKVTQYNEQRGPRPYLMTFDFMNPSTKSQHYSYDMYDNNRTFTYTIEFTNNKAVDNVTLYVKTNMGHWWPLKATYDEEKDLWVAAGEFGDSQSRDLPVNVAVDFDVVNEPQVDRREIDNEFAAWHEVFDNSDSERNAEIEAYWNKEDDADCLRLENILSQDSVDINAVSVLLDSMIEHTENLDSLSFEEVTNLYNQWIEHYEQWENTDAKTYLQMMLDDYYLDPSYDINKDFSYVLEQEGSSKVCSQTLLSSVDTVELSKSGYSLYKLNDGSSIYYYYSDELIDFIDVKNLKQYTIKINEITDSIASEARRVSNSVAGYAQCMLTAIFGIKHLYSDIKSARGASARDIAGMLLSGLGDVLDGVSCYYDGFVKALRKSIVDRYEEAAVVFNIEKKNANNLKEAIEGSMVAYKKEAADFEKRYYELKGYINNHPELSESQLKAYNDQLDNLYDSRQKALSNLAKENKQWNKVKSEIANIDLKLSKAAGKKTNLINIIDKNFPLTLKRGVRIPKSIRIAGKLAGLFGNCIQVACAFLDGWELYDDIQAWEKVMDAIDAKIPCEAQPERALSLKQEIDESSKNHIIGGCSVILGEIVAIGVSNVAVPLTPTWWVEQAINVICEAGKAYNSSSSEGRRRKLYADVRALKCKKDPEPNPNGDDGNNGKLPNNPKGHVYQGADMTFCIDPAGYVYEGVSSNRLEGVTATCYYKETVEDMYGDLHENVVLWDATKFGQENPLYTDQDGYYQWDVPEGLWQVKYEKEGYETTYSEWLPVPPPQLEVNIPMTQNVQPEVKTAHAYEDAVEVEFDKYMIPELLTTENIMVLQGDKPVDGTVELLNEEVCYEGETETFASKVRFNAAKPFTAKEVTLIVNNRVKSYAGIRMQDNYQQTFAVEQEIKEIVCEEQTAVGYGETATLTVSVLPASASKGKALTVASSSSMILGVETGEVIIGNDGKAEITISGELPGATALTFSVKGTDKTAITTVNVIQDAKVITSNIASGTVVDKGTEIVLSSTTEGAVIYYTLDGSSPSDNIAGRKVYDAPIVINENTIIKAMVVAPDMTESDVVEFTYYVYGTGINDVSIDDFIDIYPLPVRDKLNVTAGGKMIKSIVITSMNGVVVESIAKTATKVTLDVSKIPTGIYIISVTTEDGSYSRKVLKVQ